MAEKEKTTPRSTKVELQNEVKRLVAVVNAKQQAQLNPTQVKKSKRRKEVAEKTEGFNLDKVETSVNTLRGRLLGSLTDLDTSLRTKVEELSTLEEELNFKKEEVKEIYGIETNAGTLAALIEAQQESKLQYQQETQVVQDEFEEEVAAVKKKWNEEKAEYQRLKTRTAQEDSEARNRSQEQWKYQFDRDAQIQRNGLADELVQSRRELAAEVEARTKVLDERVLELDKREAAVAELEATVEELKKLNETKVETAVADTTKKLNAARAIAVSAVEKDYEAQITVLNGKLEAVETFKVNLEQRVVNLEEDLTAARKEVNQTALAALEAASGKSALEAVQAAARESGGNKGR